MNGQERSDKKFMDRWAQNRKGGTLRFIVMFGMLYCGGMYFVAMMILDHIHGGISTSMIVGRVVNSLMAGFIFGSIAWWISERRYKRIMAVAQQVDSAEASTIAVPPFGPSGSPR